MGLWVSDGQLHLNSFLLSLSLRLPCTNYVLLCRHLPGGPKTRLVPASPRDSDTSLPTRPRYALRSSLSSEVTFPLRSDAWIAADLSQRDIDTPPPALPYPAPAGVLPSTTMMGSQTSHASPLSEEETPAQRRIVSNRLSLYRD